MMMFKKMDWCRGPAHTWLFACCVEMSPKCFWDLESSRLKFQPLLTKALCSSSYCCGPSKRQTAMKLECLIKQAQIRKNPIWVPSKHAQLAEPGADVCRGITTVTVTLRGPIWDWAGHWPYTAERHTLACRTDSPNTRLVGRNTWRAGETCPSSSVAEIRL